MKLNGFIFKVCLCFLLVKTAVNAQDIGFERSRHQSILDTIKSDVKKNYYDPNFRGIDIEERFKKAKERITQAKSVGEMSAIIAQVLIDFDDSHLIFIPPGKVNKTEYGWDMKMIGDKCFITRVEPKSDAEAKGLEPGDEIYSLEGYEPTRDNLWKMAYFYNVLRPRPALRMEIIKPNGKQVQVDVNAKITEGRKVLGNLYTDFADFDREDEEAELNRVKQLYHDKIDGLFIWKMPAFSLTPSEVDDFMSKVAKKQSLILDLRGNGGGRINMLVRLIGNFFAEDVKVFDEKRRKESKPMIAKTRGKDIYAGKMIVLIDSQSASSSEIFARVMQLEKRATVIGDRSAGAVMESLRYVHSIGMDSVALYSVSVTIADLIMKDGKSPEKVGVIPDEKLLPTALDLTNKRDPVLSRAAQLLGFTITPEFAGNLFPPEKK